MKVHNNSKRQDVRTIKVEKALNDAMLTLLNSQKFEKITINGLCNEAVISRATFYAHYSDKYNMLEYWLFQYQPYKLEKGVAYKQIEETANRFVQENKKVIINLFDDADDETLEILSKYILYLLDFAQKESANGEQRVKRVVLSNFYSGGIIYYFIWLIKNKFPSDVPTMNMYLYKLIEKIRELEIA